MIERAAKLASWSLHPVRLPYRRSVTWASTVASDATFLLLRLESEDGTVGVGEMHVSARWFGTTFRTLTVALEELFLPLLAEIDVTDPTAFARRAAQFPEHMCAKALVDNALWDLASAAAGAPFWRAGGEKYLDVSWILTRQSPELMAAEAADMAARYGFRTFKLKGGQGLETDIKAIRLLRKEVGDAATIYVDSNSYYGADVAGDYLAALAADGIVGVEDPYRMDANRAFERIQANAPIPIILDAPCATLREARLFCERGAQAIALKPGRCGLTEAFAMAEHAQAKGCAVFLGSAVEAHIGSLAALAATTRLTRPASYMAAESSFFLMFGDHVTVAPLEIVDGKITLPDVAGLAEFVDWDRVRQATSA
jgi:L-alanine-DL-glutamate epimerase-like enolase superfamily enzyme